MRRWPEARAGLLVGLVALAGTGLRFYRLGERSIWFDESFTWRVCQFPWAEIYGRVARDNTLPLHYYFLAAWRAAFGVSALALRSLSVGSGGVAIIGMYLLLSELFRPDAPDGGGTGGGFPRHRQVGLIGAVLLAVNIFQIRWSWDIRMYALGTALAMLSSWALVRALRSRGQPRGPWLVFGLTALMFAYTHYFALFLIAAQAVFLGGLLVSRHRRSPAGLFRDRLLGNAVLAGSVVGLGWLPWLPNFLAQRAQVRQAFWVPALSWSTFQDTIYQLLFFPARPEPSGYDGATPALILVAAGLAGLLWRARSAEVFLAMMAAGPIAMCAAVSALGTNVFEIHYFLFNHLFFIAILAVLIGRVPVPSARAAAVALVVANCLWSYREFWHQAVEPDRRPGARGAAEFIARNWRPGDRVVVSTPPIYLPLKFYTHDPRSVWVWDRDGYIPHFEGPAALTPEELVSQNSLRVWTADRVWYVSGSAWGSVSVPLPDHWRPVTRVSFADAFPATSGRLFVKCYETRSGPTSSGPALTADR